MYFLGRRRRRCKCSW